MLLTPIFFIVAMWVSVFPHEYAHAATAWLYGYKLSPFDIYYGHFNWQNVMFVTGIDEDVNYYLMYLFNQPRLIGWVGFAGPGIATLGIYLLSLCLLHWEKVKKRPYLFYFLVWVNLINLSELLSYVILRSFSAHGDMAHIVFGWGISPWWIFLGGGMLVFIGVWHFFKNIATELYVQLNLKATTMKVVLLIFFTWVLFGQGGVRMFLDSYGLSSTILAVLFFLCMPVIVFICWPTRSWVTHFDKSK